MELFLIRFKYEHYCQGIEWVTETVLVHADTFSYACSKIKSRYDNANEFENLTIL